MNHQVDPASNNIPQSLRHLSRFPPLFGRVAGKVRSASAVVVTYLQDPKFALLWCLLCNALTVAFTVWGFGRGFDFTDEAGNTISGEYPVALTARLTEFGYLTNVLYRLAGGDMFTFRLLGLVALLLVASFFCWEMMRFLRNRMMHYDRVTAVCVYSAMLTSSLGFYCKWFPAPNYYLVCLVGLLGAIGSLLFLVNNRENTLSFYLGNISLALFVTIAALGRITSAAFLVVLIVAGIVWRYRSQRKMLIRSLCTIAVVGIVATLAYMEFVAGGISDVVQAYSGLLNAPLDYSGHSSASIFGFLFRGLDYFVTISFDYWIMVIIFPSVGALCFRLLKKQWIAVVTVVVLFAWPLHIYKSRYYIDASDYTATIFILSFVSLVFFVVFLGSPKDWKSYFLNLCYGLALAVCCLPLAFGSNVPVEWHASLSLCFLVAGTFVVASIPANTAIVRTTAVACSAFVLIVILVSLTHTHRQGALWDHTVSTDLRGDGHSLKLLPAMAKVIPELREVAAAHGWTAGTPLVDFSGGYAGIAYVLQARPTALSRICTGYGEASEYWAACVVDSIPEQIRSESWVTTSNLPPEKGGLSTAFINQLLPGFPNKYEVVYEFPSVFHPGIEPPYTIKLWRPVVSSEKERASS